MKKEDLPRLSDENEVRFIPHCDAGSCGLGCGGWYCPYLFPTP